MTHPQLKLVWVNEAFLAGEPRIKKNKRAEGDEKKSLFTSAWEWLRINGSAISALIAILVLVSGIAVTFAFKIPWFLSDLYTRFTAMESSIQGTGQNKGVVQNVADLTAELGKLKAFLAGKGILDEYYKNVAVKERGYRKNPDVIPINLVYPQKPTDKPLLHGRVESEPGEAPYNLTYELVELTASEMTFLVNGKVGTSVLKNNRVTVPLKLNEPVEVPPFIKGQPRVFFEVIARPSEDLAIVALGPKADKQS